MTLLPKLEAIIPTKMRRLPIDERGYCVPKFASWIDGKPDFRLVDSRHFERCITQKVCWLCGEPLGRYRAFVIGPMCAVNRITAEPPSHLECAQFAVKACPFMVFPQRKRNVNEPYPEGCEPPAGIMIDRNPGVMLIWITEKEKYHLFRTGHRTPGSNDGLLFSLAGEPHKLEWYTRGVPATRDEILASISSGSPALRKIAEDEGTEAVNAFEYQLERSLALVPAR